MSITGIEVKRDMGKRGIDECRTVEEIGERLCWWDVVAHALSAIDTLHDHHPWPRPFRKLRCSSHTSALVS